MITIPIVATFLIYAVSFWDPLDENLKFGNNFETRLFVASSLLNWLTWASFK